MQFVLERSKSLVYRVQHAAICFIHVRGSFGTLRYAVAKVEVLSPGSGRSCVEEMYDNGSRGI